TDTMSEVFRNIIGEFQIFELVGDDPLELINKFIAAITSSINMSVNLTPFRITLCYYLPRNVEELKNTLYFENLIAKHFDFKIAQEPFAEGKERYSYFDINTKCNPPRRIIMKEFLSEREDTFEKYLESVEISAITTYLSIKFNSAAGRKNIPL
ncbi:24448_t:CDS:2, partial [Racocetra persica]